MRKIKEELLQGVKNLMIFIVNIKNADLPEVASQGIIIAQSASQADISWPAAAMAADYTWQAIACLWYNTTDALEYYLTKKEWGYITI